jgi:hypothetical protein
MRICTSILLNPCITLDSPHVLRLESLSGSLNLSIAYGVNIESENDKFYSASEEAMAAVDIALMPGAFLVDLFPIRMCSCQRGHFSEELIAFIITVKWVPEWVPGAGFKKFARITKKSIDDSVNLPFQHVKKSFEVCKPHHSSPRHLT